MVAISPQEAATNTNVADKIPFRWTYILLPVGFLFLSIVLTAFFYRLLPPEVAYHFHNDSPDRFIPRDRVLLWLLVPQVFFSLLAFIVTRTIMLSARYWQAEATLLKRIIPVMGNMLALPQMILAFALLGILLYNSYQIILLPLWAFAVIVMALGGIVLGIFFVRIVRRSHALRNNNLRE